MSNLESSRITLVTALAWRAMTELVRRHHISHAFGLRQIHPGASMRGLLALVIESRSRGLQSTLRFHLGGGESGKWEVEAGASGNVADLLADDPSQRIDEMQRAAGLPAQEGRVPASSDAVMAMRMIATMLERKVFEPVPWRITLGLIGWSPDIVSDWHRHFIGRVQQDSWGGVSDKDAERLFQLVLLHEAHDEAPAHSQENIKGSALAVDLATGIAVRMTATEVEPLAPARTIYDKAITKSGY